MRRGSVQSGFCDVALSAVRSVLAARPHRSFQILLWRNENEGMSEGIARVDISSPDPKPDTSQFSDLSPDQLLERAQRLRELGEVWRALLWELADALEALAQENRGGRKHNPN